MINQQTHEIILIWKLWCYQYMSDLCVLSKMKLVNWDELAWLGVFDEFLIAF